jgi:aldose sugar dehydrogenase
VLLRYFFVYAAYTIASPFAGSPTVNNPALKVQTAFTGLKAPTTSMAFLGQNDILVLEKNRGTVQRIINGKILSQPILEVPVATNVERGMLGIAIDKNSTRHATYVFLFYTESGGGKRADDFYEGIPPSGNRLYRYELVNNKLVNPKLLLSLPAIPSNATSPETSRHNGGKVVIGPDNNVYVVIGDVSGHRGQAQNVASGAPLDGTSGILRVTQDGQAVKDNPFVNEATKGQQQGSEGDRSHILETTLEGGQRVGEGNISTPATASSYNNTTNALSQYYYAYGIRNSFGMDFDPVTKKLWDTENGPTFGDEINLVEPGFNSGWARLEGIWTIEGAIGRDIVVPVNSNPSNLVDIGGKGKYRAPEFTWFKTVAPTALKFLKSDRLGKQYENTIFIGDVNTGNLYNFKLNENRTGLLLHGRLEDKVANTTQELQEGEIIFGEGFGTITDIQVGPEDGYLYILTYQGTIYRIIPSSS